MADFSATSSTKPFVFVEDNTFIQNQAYLSGNALYMRSTKKSVNPLNTCGVARLDGNTFDSNFGFKVSDGGALSILCDVITDTTSRDYDRSSDFEDAVSTEDPLIDIVTNFLLVDT